MNISNLTRSRPLRLLVSYLLLVLTLSACNTQTVQRRYYTLISPAREIPTTSRYPVDVWLRETDVAPVVNRPQVVYRITPTELQYYNLEYWADRPARMVTQSLERALRTSGIFRSVSPRLGTRAPEYTFESTIQAMEQLDGGEVWYAHLAMDFRLVRFDGDAVIWRKSFDERRPVNTKDVGLTVRALSEILTEQLDISMREVDAVLAGKKVPTAAAPAAKLPAPSAGAASKTSAADMTPPSTLGGLPAPSGDETEKKEGESAEPTPTPQPPLQPLLPPGAVSEPGGTIPLKSGTAAAVVEAPDKTLNADLAPLIPKLAKIDWTRTQQYTSDPTLVPPGQGAIFLPALSGSPEREAPVEVYKNSQYVATGLMGRRIPVEPGTYQVFFGSGVLSERLATEVTVREGRVTIVPPTWATLEVTVVSDTFIPYRGSYELLNMATREFVGVGYGADQELGEDTQIWVLEPGLFKVVQPGATYRSRRNFATVMLTSSSHTPFTLVIDPATRDFLGAGVDESLEEGPEKEKRWTMQSTVGGDLNWIRRSADSNAQPGTTVGVNFYADNLLKFRASKHLWTTRFEVEEGSSLEGPETFSPSWWDESRSVTSADRLYLNSIYMYELRPRIGSYLRMGGETFLQNRYKDYSATDEGVIPSIFILDEQGNELCTAVPERENGGETPAAVPTAGTQDSYCDHIASERVRLAGPFSPLELKQGVGLNFRLVHNTSLDLDLRLGVGSRQSLQNGRLRYVEEGSTPISLYFQKVANAYALGPETTVVASARVTRYFQGSTELDALVPFVDGFDALQFTWRTTASLRLSSYASLVYVLDLDRNPNVGRLTPLVVDQSLLLRFSYSLL